jgi:hypothetical protein
MGDVTGEIRGAIQKVPEMLILHANGYEYIEIPLGVSPTHTKHHKKEILPGSILKVAEALGSVCALPRGLL